MSSCPQPGSRRASLVRRTVVTAVALALGLTVAPSVAAPPAVPVLTTQVQLTTTGTGGVADVRLLKNITTNDLAKTGIVSATGNGMLVVALLRPGGAATDARGVVYTRIAGDPDFRGSLVGAAPQNIGVPSGTYRLYVFGDSSATVNLKFGAQRAGLLRLRAAKPAKGRIAMVPVPPSAQQAAETHDTYTASREFVAIAFAIFEFRTRHVLNAASCSYETGNPPPVTLGCVNGRRGDSEGGNGSLQPFLTPDDIGFSTYTRSGSGKTLTFGIDYTTTGILTKLTRWNVWIEV